MVNVVVLGASPNSGPLKEISSAPAEALIKIGSKPMIRYVLEALLATSAIDNIVLVGPVVEFEPMSSDRVKVTPGGETAIESLIRGVESLPSNGPVLIVTCDIPLLTPEAIDNFLKQCQQEQADVYYPVIPRELVENRFPGVKRTYVNFREGTFTGGNIFLINPQIIAPCAQKGQEMVDLRKSPFKLAKLLGLPFIAKFLTKTLSLPEVERKVSNLLHIRGKVIVTGYPEIGVDVDKPSDFHLVEDLLKTS